MELREREGNKGRSGSSGRGRVREGGEKGMRVGAGVKGEETRRRMVCLGHDRE